MKKSKIILSVLAPIAVIATAGGVVATTLTLSSCSYENNSTSKNALVGLWNSVEEYIQSKNIIVSKSNDLDTYHNEEQNILNNVIKTFEVNSNLSFKDSVQNISREFDAIKIKIADNKFDELKNMGLFNSDSNKFTDKDILIDEANKTILLSGLGFQSPKEYFVQENGKYILNKTKLGECSETEIFLPKNITPNNVDENIFNIVDEHVNKIENISLHDDFIFTSKSLFHRQAGSNQILKNVKLPRKLSVLPDLTFWFANVQNIHMYSNLVEIGNSCFHNAILPKNFTLPKSVNIINAHAFASFAEINGGNGMYSWELETFTTSAKILKGNILGYQKKLKEIIFLFNDVDVSKWDVYTFTNLEESTKIYVKNETIKNAIAEKYTDLKQEIIVNPNLK